MILKHLELQNFRSYSKVAFDFDPQTTVVIGPNAVGKTNLLEAIYLAATGKSFKSEKEGQLIQFGKQGCRVKAVVSTDAGPVGRHPRPTASLASLSPGARRGTPTPATRSDVEEYEVEETELEVVLSQGQTNYLQRKYLVNGVPKRRVDFASHLNVVLFTPLDLDIVSGQPSVRRNYLNEILEQTDPEYRMAFAHYTKALRQRNALLEQAQKSGYRDEDRFAYWDELLITNGQLVTKKRQELISYINAADKQLFPFVLEYDKSTISEERLLQYKHAEVGAGVTLVGPQRDDVIITSFQEASKSMEPVKHFCSRGQQRLVTLELKKMQIAYITDLTGAEPLLLLDDIFSELDSSHINLVLELIGKNQTILTTTHREFVDAKHIKQKAVIELGH